MIREGFCYDDVLLVPNYSDIKSRSSIDLSVKLGDFTFSHPIIPANMKSIIGLDMAYAIINSGGLAILHRFLDIDKQLSIAEDIIDNFGNKNFAVSVGIKEEDLNNLIKFDEIDVKIVCIDIAHGDSEHCINMIKAIKTKLPNMYIIAGNVATGKGAERLWTAGADVVKCGVGPGILCSTRIETGNGVPQLTAIMDVAEAQKRMLNLYKTKDGLSSTRQFPFIADGGLSNAGNVTKALCYADMVMIGNLFAGCDEAPGDIVNLNGKQYKEYAGSSTHKTNYIEGVVSMAPYKGPYLPILTKLLEGLRSGMSYQGVDNLIDLKDNPEFIRITSAGLKESHPHDVILK